VTPRAHYAQAWRYARQLVYWCQGPDGEPPEDHGGPTWHRTMEPRFFPDLQLGRVAFGHLRSRDREDPLDRAAALRPLRARDLRADSRGQR